MENASQEPATPATQESATKDTTQLDPAKREVLTELMVKYGTFKNKLPAERKQDWINLTAEFNSKTGCEKTVAQVKKCWHNYQRPLKQKRSKHESGKHMTGGGTNPAPALTEEEAYALDVASNDPPLILKSVWDSNAMKSAPDHDRFEKPQN